MRLKSIFFLIIIFIGSCTSQKGIQKDELLKESNSLKVIEASRQNIYPGVSDGTNQYKQRWMIQLDNSVNRSGRISLLLNDRRIDLGELVVKGVVMGDDNDDVFITKDVTFPIEYKYPKSEYGNSDSARLLFENDGNILLLTIDSVIVLPDIIYPSNTN